MVETLVFLAVTGAMFTGAVGVFTSQQRATQFSQSVRQFEAEISDVINNTSTGVFPELFDISCSYAGAVIQFTRTAGSESGKGNGCMFVGQAVQVGINPFSTDTNRFVIQTLVGSNLAVNTSNFSQTYPSALYSGGGFGSPVFDTSEDGQLEWGLEFGPSFYVDGTDTYYASGFGVFYSRFGETNRGNEFVSGASSVSLYAITANGSQARNYSSVNLDEDTFRTGISHPASLSIVELDSPLYVCLEGPYGRRAMLVVGNVNGSLTARADFNARPECTV